jgi:hypothetical protein
VVRSVTGPHPSLSASLVSRDPATGRIRDALEDVPLSLAGDDSWETPWITAVADAEDRDASWLAGTAIVARLGDVVELRCRVGAGRAQTTRRTVGSAFGRAGSLSILTLAVRPIVLRARRGGPPSIGGDDDGAAKVVLDQLEVAGAVLAQCGVALRAERLVEIADPPGPCLIRVGGRYGLPAAGGEIRLAVDGRELGAVRVEHGATPEATARRVAEALAAAGFRAEIELDARTGREALPTADVVVRRADGSPARVTSVGDGAAPSTDPRQPLEIGEVDLSDGLDAYAADDAGLGTLEERALIRALGGGPRGLDVFFVDRLVDDTKQGESFLPESSVGPAVIVDARGVARARQAYALAHEIAHVLLGDLGHPDDAGDDRTWLLMSSRSASARLGPKRLTDEECARIRANASGLLAGDR